MVECPSRYLGLVGLSEQFSTGVRSVQLCRRFEGGKL